MGELPILAAVPVPSLRYECPAMQVQSYRRVVWPVIAAPACGLCFISVSTTIIRHRLRPGK